MLLLAASFFGCEGKKTLPQTDAGTAAEKVKTAENTAPATESATAAPDTEKTAPVWYTTPEECGKVDLDLTPLSITMLYSEVYNMMSSPEKYIGKRVKTVGQFTVVQMYDSEGKPIPEAVYYICAVNDATACCQTGLEFILKGDPAYPEDYPKESSVITVVGEFQTYMEGTTRYCHLVDAQLIVK